MSSSRCYFRPIYSRRIVCAADSRSVCRTYSRVYLRHNCSCIFNEACVIPLFEMFYLNDVLQNWNRLLIECRMLDHSIVVNLLQPSVSGVAVFLLMPGLTMDTLSTFSGVFVVQCVKLMLRFFLIWGLTDWLFCLSPKCNSFETFYHIWALRRWGGRHRPNHMQTHSCHLNRFAIN